MSVMVEPRHIARVMGLRGKIESLDDLAAAVQAGLPKSSLATALAKVFRSSGEASSLMKRVVPPATFHRRGKLLKQDESEQTERLARVIATAQFVWDDDEEARLFLTTPNRTLRGSRPIDIALTELGARRVEQVLWSLFYGLPA